MPQVLQDCSTIGEIMVHAHQKRKKRKAITTKDKQNKRGKEKNLFIDYYVSYFLV